MTTNPTANPMNAILGAHEAEDTSTTDSRGADDEGVQEPSKGIGTPAPSQAAPTRSSSTTPTSTQPGPCSNCGCAVWWLDPYGRQHCGGCDPPPTEAMARRWLTAIVLPDGRFAWENEPMPLDGGAFEVADPDGWPTELLGNASEWTVRLDGDRWVYQRRYFEHLGPPPGEDPEWEFDRPPRFPPAGSQLFQRRQPGEQVPQSQCSVRTRPETTTHHAGEDGALMVPSADPIETTPTR